MADSEARVAFVKASIVRTAAVVALQDWPKTTGQVAEACGISPAHASRAIRELMDGGLAESLTPERRGRGRLYGLTTPGQTLAASLQWEGRRPLTIPMVRGTHPRAWFRVLESRLGRTQARVPFVAAGLEGAIDAPAQRWVPLRSMMRVLDQVEAQWGDGTNELIREFGAEAVPYFPSVRRYLMRALPVRVLADLAPAAYLREFNHGRMEVETSEGHAHFKQYDWLSSPARCMAWLGTYEGAFAFKKVRARTRKVECLLRGDEFCGYVVEWDE